MKHSKALFPIYLLIGSFAASCASMQPSAGVRDDIYYMPSDAPPVAEVPREMPVEERRTEPVDDYYDPGTAKDYVEDRNYYDMAYNDPYYYNYGRFGFGGGMGMGMMGYQSGWGGPGWGSGMGWGYGMGGWSMSMGYGYGNGFYDPWGYPYWGRPMGYSPWGWNDPYMGGYGYGNYYGPYGNCYACYAPVVVGASSGVVVGHRPSLTGMSASSSNTGGGGPKDRARTTGYRDPVGLTPATRMEDMNSTISGSGIEPTRSGRSPAYRTPNKPPIQERTRPANSGRQIERGGVFDRGGESGGGINSGGSSPSRSGSGGGGGSRPSGSPRPR